MKQIVIKKGGRDVLPSGGFSKFFIETLDKHGLVKTGTKGIMAETYRKPILDNMDFSLDFVLENDIEVDAASGAILIEKTIQDGDIEFKTFCSPEELAEGYANAKNTLVSLDGMRALLKLIARFYYKQLSKEELDTIAKLQKDIEKSVFKKEYKIFYPNLLQTKNVLVDLEKETDIPSSVTVFNKTIEWLNTLMLLSCPDDRLVHFDEESMGVSFSTSGLKKLEEKFLDEVLATA